MSKTSTTFSNVTIGEHSAERVIIRHETGRDLMSEKIVHAAEVEKLLLTGEAATVFTVYWRPIETAPKDGTRVLIWEPPGQGFPGFIYVSAWHDYPRGGGAWCEVECEQWATFSPTHWMPLPNPPAGATS